MDKLSPPISIDVRKLTVPKLLSCYGAILEELRHRGIVRSSNNPLSDYAEGLFCATFSWKQEGNSSAGYDAIDADGVRYQIKARRLRDHKTSRQMSAIRSLPETPFDFLAGLLVNQEFDIIRAAIVPVAVVQAKAKYVGHTNSWRFLLRDDVWSEPSVRDVTAEVSTTATAI